MNLHTYQLLLTIVNLSIKWIQYSSEISSFKLLVLFWKLKRRFIHSFVHSFEYSTDNIEKIHHQSNLLYGVSTKGTNTNFHSIHNRFWLRCRRDNGTLYPLYLINFDHYAYAYVIAYFFNVKSGLLPV